MKHPWILFGVSALAVGATALLFFTLKQPGIHEQATLPGRFTELQPWDHPFLFEADALADEEFVSTLYGDSLRNGDGTDWEPYDSFHSDALGREWLSRATEARPASIRTHSLSEYLMAGEPITDEELEFLVSTGRA